MNALIMETQELYRLTLKEIISLLPNCRSIKEVNSGQELLSIPAEKAELNLIVLTPYQLGVEGANWLHLVKELFPFTAILAFYDREKPRGLIETDSRCEMLPREATVEQTLSALRRILNIPVVSTNSIQAKYSEKYFQMEQNFEAETSGTDHDKFPYLSGRQKQILDMASGGLANKEIAARLLIAEGTVKAHMHAIFKLLNVTNRTQAVLKYSSPIAVRA